MARPARRRLISCLLLIAATSAVACAEAVVVYLDGVCEVADGDAWYLLGPGDVIGPDDTIRVSRGAYIEIEAGSGTIRLTGEGDYRVADLLGRTEAARSAGARRMFTSRLERILGTVDPLPQTTGSGVRGDESDRDQLPPTGRDAERIRRASSLMASGDLQAACDELKAGLREIVDVRFRPYYIYLLGATAYGLDETAEALARLEDPGPDPDLPFYYDHAMLLSQVEIELFQYEQAIGVLEDLAAWYAGLDRDSDAQLLLGMAYLGAGRTDLAVEHLNRVTEEPARAVARALLTDVGDQPPDE